MKIKLTYPLSAEEIKTITGGISSVARDTRIECFATHSSEVTKGTLFIAMQGKHTHGEAFRDEVIKRDGYLLTDRQGDRSFTVPAAIDALFALAHAHLKRLSALKHTVAVTGSVGKTTTKEMLRLILSDHFRTHATEGNQNSEIGLPLTILSAPLDTELLILEMGMNHKGEIAQLSALARPDVIIITNIGHAHIGNLGSRAAIAEAKKESLIGAKSNATILIPAGEPLLADVQGAKKIGLFCEDGDYRLIRSAEGENAHLLLKAGGTRIPVFDEAYDKGILSAVTFSSAAALEMGISPSKITDNISKITTNIFRQKRFERDKIEIIFDAYNASYESVLCAIEALKGSKKQSRALLLGDMWELGEYSEALHRAVGSACAAARDKITFLFLFGKEAEAIADQAMHDGYDASRIFLNKETTRPDVTAKAILSLAHCDTCLWIKGARGMQMERILKILINDAGDDSNAG